MQGRGTASGKVILFGEHAVVYGVPAIAAGISRGAIATAHPEPDDALCVNSEELAPEHELYAALRALRETLNAPTARVHLELEIPAGAGLGASAAMAMACARAFVEMQGLEIAPSQRRLFEAAQSWEQVFHGTPSGVDVAAASRSGVIQFRRGEEPESLVIQQPLALAIAQAGPPASTKSMVNGVAKFKERNPTQFQRTLEGIAALVDNGKLLLRQGDLKAVGKLMDLNQMLLAGWMLSTTEIESACRIARDTGALGAKLTGAGGGGCVVALCATKESAESVVSAWKQAEMPAFVATVGEETAPEKKQET